MIEWMYAAIGGLIGMGAGWLWSQNRARTSADEHLRRAAAAESESASCRTQIETLRLDLAAAQSQVRQTESERAVAMGRAEELEKAIREQRSLLEEARSRLADTFKSLAADALKNSNQDFLTLAKEALRSIQTESSGDLDQRRQAIEHLVAPLRETLDAYRKESRSFEDRRLSEQSSLQEQIRALAEANMKLQGETGKLVTALTTPQVRGRWGEMTLRRCAELSGMSAHCDFVEQASVATEDGRLRPDMIVKMPSQREIVIDSKVPFDGYWASVEATSDKDRESALLRHAQIVKHHVSDLSAKEYWDQFKSAPEFVVLFIPNESFLAAAAEKDPDLMESALAKRIVIATPSIFIALLRAIAFGWRQEQLAENALLISRLGQELHERMAVLAEHLARIGDHLGKSVESYNAAVSSLETRVLSTARKFKTLGAGSKREIADVATVDRLPRRVDIPQED